MRFVVLVMAVVFPVLFGIAFTASLMTIRYPMPTKRVIGRSSYVGAAIARAATYAALTFVIAVALHQAAHEAIGVAAALTAGPFVAGAVAGPIVSARIAGRRPG